MSEIKGKGFFLNDVHVGKRGQLVIPKDTRDLFNIKPGDHLVLIGDKTRGIAIMKPEQIREFAQLLMGGVGKTRGGKKGSR